MKNANKWVPFLTGFLFVLIIGLGSFLRLWNLGLESLRLDETQSIWQASHSLQFIKDYMIKNVHMPLHNSLLHFWLQKMGSSETSVRLMAAIPGILSLPAFYFLAKEIFGRRDKALLSLLLASISPLWIWYSREIRMYTLLLLITVLSYLFYVRFLKYYKKLDLVAYIIVNIVGVYTHYFFSLVLLVQAIYFLVVWKFGLIEKVKEKGKKMFAYLIFAALCIAGAFAPWVYNLAQSYGSGSLAPILAKPTSFNLLLSYFEFTLGYQPETMTGNIIAMWPLAVLIGFIFLAKRENPFKAPIYLVILGATLPVILVYLISITIRPIYLTRYVVMCLPFYIILLAWVLSSIKGTKKYILNTFIIGVFCFAVYNQFFSHDIPAKENYRDAINYINANATTRDAIIVSPAYTIYPTQYYINSDSRIYTMPIWNKKKGAIPVLTQELLESDSKIVQQGHEKIYLLVTLDLQDAAQVKAYYDQNYTKLDKQQFSKYIWVHVYQAEYL